MEEKAYAKVSVCDFFHLQLHTCFTVAQFLVNCERDSIFSLVVESIVQYSFQRSLLSTRLRSLLLLGKMSNSPYDRISQHKYIPYSRDVYKFCVTSLNIFRRFSPVFKRQNKTCSYYL